MVVVQVLQELVVQMVPQERQERQDPQALQEPQELPEHLALRGLLVPRGLRVFPEHPEHLGFLE